MNNSRNFIFAIVISLLIFYSYHLIRDLYFPVPRIQHAQHESKVHDNNTASPNNPTSTTQPPAVLPHHYVYLENDDVICRLDTTTSIIDKLRLKKYITNQAYQKHIKNDHTIQSTSLSDAHFNIDAEDKDIQLAPYSNNVELLCGASCIQLNLEKQNNDYQWHIVATQPNKVTLKTQIDNIIITRVITLQNGYVLNIHDTPVNADNQSPTNIQSRIVMMCQKNWNGSMNLYEGPVSYFNNDFTQPAEKSIQMQNVDGWIGISNDYWFICATPNGAYNVTGTLIDIINDNKKDQYYTIKIDHNMQNDAVICFGPKEIQALDNYEVILNKPHLDLVIDFGYMYFITKPLVYFVSYLCNHIKNVGICILLCTILIRILLLPISWKANISMIKMRTLQPKLAVLNSRYAHDKIALGKAMGDLYKKEKINPSTGCLLQLLQLPFFIALYKVFLIAIEIRQAPFLWMSDLSQSDSVYVFNLFGLLPFTPPSMLQIGLMPVLMGLSMFLQQYLQMRQNASIGASTEQNKTMLWLLPCIFIYSMSQMSCAITLYWTFGNLLSILQQLISDALLSRRQSTIVTRIP